MEMRAGEALGGQRTTSFTLQLWSSCDRGRKNETWRNLVNISRSRLARLEGFLLGAVVSGRGRLFCFRINGRSALGLQPAGPNVISVSELSHFIYDSSPVFELLTSSPATLTARVCFLPLQLPKPCRMIY